MKERKEGTKASHLITDWDKAAGNHLSGFIPPVWVQGRIFLRIHNLLSKESANHASLLTKCLC